MLFASISVHEIRPERTAVIERMFDTGEGNPVCGTRRRRREEQATLLPPGAFDLKTTLVTAFALFCALAFAARAAADGGRLNATTVPHVLRLATGEDVAGLNPDLSTQLVVAFLSQMTAAYLFRSDRENKFVPELATKVPTTANGGVSPDGKTITIDLRRGVKWSDGAPFDADDVVFSIAAMNNPANRIPVRDGFDHVTSVDEPNKYRVVVHLREPYFAIVPKLFSSANTLALLPKHILAAQPDINTGDFDSLPVGIGPFRYAAWKRGDSVELEANPLYWRGRPKLDRVILKLIPDRNTVLAQLQTGEIDMWYPFGGAFLARVTAMPSVTVLRTPAYAFNEITLNLKNAALADVNVRRALELATDRKTVVEKVGHGVGVLQEVSAPLVDPAVPKDIPFTQYDPAKADALLDREGWVRGSDGIRAKGGTRLSFDLATSSGSPDVDLQIELIRSWWKDVGVELNVQHYDPAMLFAARADNGILYNGKFDIAFVAWSVNEPVDPTELYGCKEAPPQGHNIGSYCNPKLDVLLDDLHGASDEAQYRADLEKALRLIATDVPVIVANGRENIFGFNRDLKNFHPNSITVFDDMMNVDI
jgi:peptide/nickel transport system substrate-binding protein